MLACEPGSNLPRLPCAMRGGVWVWGKRHARRVARYCTALNRRSRQDLHGDMLGSWQALMGFVGFVGPVGNHVQSIFVFPRHGMMRGVANANVAYMFASLLLAACFLRFLVLCHRLCWFFGYGWFVGLWLTVMLMHASPKPQNYGALCLCQRQLAYYLLPTRYLVRW